MIKKIEEYIESHAKVWASSTLRSERHRLNAMAKGLDSPESLWGLLQDYAPYSRRTYFTRASKFMEWCGNNSFTVWAGKHPHLFRNAYTRRQPIVSYESAKQAIAKIKHDASRLAAQLMLSTGMRYCELETFDGVRVIGKGGKERRIFTECKPVVVDYQVLYRTLKTVGLKPHDLRKLFASELVRRGANEFELTRIMGWSNMQTALSYVRSDEGRLEALVKEAA